MSMLDLGDGYQARHIPKRRAYDVLCPAGDVVAEGVGYEGAFTAAWAHYRRRSMRERSCMTCGGDFVSQGPWNRMCKRCREWAADQG